MGKGARETRFTPSYRKAWKQRLPKDNVTHIIIEGLWHQLDQVEEIREKILGHIRRQSRGYSEINRFREIPGIGMVNAATVSAIVEDPHRFANKKKLWMYGSLGLAERESGGKLYSRKFTRNFNRHL